MSRKAIHPIRRMQRAIRKSNQYWDFDPSKEARAIARHVKPLLDALEEETERHVKPEAKFPDGSPMDPCRCSSCQLLAAWRAPL